MSNPNPNVPSVSLAIAVLMQVQEFVTANKEFSRYEITKELRNKCNSGLMEIPEVESPGGGSVRYDIRKDAVDTIFDQYLQNLAANNLPPLKWRFDNSLRYRLFSEDLTAQLVSNPTAVPVVVSTNSNNIGGNFPTPSVAPTPKSVPNDNELRRRMSVYMRNCQIVGMVPTLKQVQSAIKRKHSTGLTVKEIYNMATSMGFVVR